MAGEDSTVSGVAGRYARALFELALDSKSVDAVKADIEKFDTMIAESTATFIGLPLNVIGRGNAETKPAILPEPNGVGLATGHFS